MNMQKTHRESNWIKFFRFVEKIIFTITFDNRALFDFRGPDTFKNLCDHYSVTAEELEKVFGDVTRERIVTDHPEYYGAIIKEKIDVGDKEKEAFNQKSHGTVSSFIPKNHNLTIVSREVPCSDFKIEASYIYMWVKPNTVSSKRLSAYVLQDYK